MAAPRPGASRPRRHRRSSTPAPPRPSSNTAHPVGPPAADQPDWGPQKHRGRRGTAAEDPRNKVRWRRLRQTAGRAIPSRRTPRPPCARWARRGDRPSHPRHARRSGAQRDAHRNRSRHGDDARSTRRRRAKARPPSSRSRSRYEPSQKLLRSGTVWGRGPYRRAIRLSAQRGPHDDFFPPYYSAPRPKTSSRRGFCGLRHRAGEGTPPEPSTPRGGPVIGRSPCHSMDPRGRGGPVMRRPPQGVPDIAWPHEVAIAADLPIRHAHSRRPTCLVSLKLQEN